ncbi:MAG: hypothetical protein KKA56_06290, partial [Gammaproteobacteria bacterium]|nr:hypothetical protein [Gammaproteobacteria bacterium]
MNSAQNLGLSPHQQLSDLQQQYQLRRWRLPLWLQLEIPTDLPWLQQTVLEILTSQTASRGFWLGELLPDVILPDLKLQDLKLPV